MTSKLHNRTLFVAALSVYFGLLIVGAPPLVLAQTAKSSIVEGILKDEKLKKRYDEDESFRRAIDCTVIKPRITKKGSAEKLEDNYSIEDFAVILADFSQYSVCMSPENFGVRVEISYTNSPQFLSGAKLGYLPSTKNHWLNGILVTYGESLGNSLPHLREAGKKYFQIDFAVTPENLSSIARFEQSSGEQAQAIADSFQIYLSNAKAANKNNPEAILLENTKISFENNQVLVVTNLPRAGLDSLLKADEKAN
jgi:hypothetical protein